MDSGLNWTSIIYLLGVLLLISPTIAYVFKAPNALRNATIWLAILTGIAWAYQLWGDKFAGNFINMPSNYASTSPAKPDAEEVKLAPDAEDNPIRNP